MYGKIDSGRAQRTGSRFQRADGMKVSPRKDPMLRSSLAFAAVALAACSSQASPSYKGEALAQLHGSVQVDSATPVTPPAPLETALMWSGVAPYAFGKTTVSRREVGTTVPVSGQFPASFTLEIYTPPPALAMFTCSESGASPGGMRVQVASANVEALLQGADTTDYDYSDLYGQVKDYIILYADADLPADNACEIGAVTKGYHLLHYAPDPNAKLPDVCSTIHAPDDSTCRGPWPYVEVAMATPLTLVLEHDDVIATPPPAPSPAPSTGNTSSTDGPPSGN